MQTVGNVHLQGTEVFNRKHGHVAVIPEHPHAAMHVDTGRKSAGGNLPPIIKPRIDGKNLYLNFKQADVSAFIRP